MDVYPGGGSNPETSIHVQASCALFEDEAGVTAIEYGLIAALIAVVIIVAVTSVGTNLSSVFNAIAANLATATS
jgi:pilus assembly protein Flp/PilA